METKKTFPSEGKQGIKLQAAIIKNALGLLFPALTSSESILLLLNTTWLITRSLSWPLEFKLIRMWRFVHPYTQRKAHWGDHTHAVPPFSRVSPLYNNCSCHTTSQHFFACSWFQLTHHVPSKAQGSSQSIASGNISKYLAVGTNMQTQLYFLPCYDRAVLSQFWPPSFHWLGTGGLSDRGVWTEGEGQKDFHCPIPHPLPFQRPTVKVSQES